MMGWVLDGPCLLGLQTFWRCKGVLSKQILQVAYCRCSGYNMIIQWDIQDKYPINPSDTIENMR